VDCKQKNIIIFFYRNDYIYGSLPVPLAPAFLFYPSCLFMRATCQIHRKVLVKYPYISIEEYKKDVSYLSTDIYLSIHPSIHLSIYGSTALVDLGRFFSFLIRVYTQFVRLLGREISQSQGRYLHTEQHKHRINAHRHTCLESDSNPLSRCSSGRRRFMS
jgi:hypothetical protein